MLKTGPSVHTQTFPRVVFSTQQRQAPTPQAIIFSSDTSQGVFVLWANCATAFIIGIGPQHAMFENFLFSML